jgi:hypothetical protein
MSGILIHNQGTTTTSVQRPNARKETVSTRWDTVFDGTHTRVHMQTKKNGEPAKEIRRTLTNAELLRALKPRNVAKRKSTRRTRASKSRTKKRKSK